MLKTKKNLSTNIIFSIMTQVAAFLTPLIISPYISRVLTAELIGIYSYILANSSYFVLVELIGLPLYGTIKCAAIRDDKQELSKMFWEIMLLKMLLMIVNLVIYVYFFVITGEIQYRKLYLIVLCNLIANGIDVTWILNALEEFRIVAIRSIIVRIVNLVAIILLVKSEDDFYIYVVIMQMTTLVSYIVVWPLLKGKIFGIKDVKINIFRHLKPSMIYFIPGVINTIYSATDKTILGVLGEDVYEIGVYEQANKISQLFMNMVTAISNVLLPRITYLYHNDKDGQADKLLNMILKMVFLATVPIVAGLVLVSDVFVPVFFGAGYEKTIILLKILSFNILFVTLSNFLGQQCLIARNRQMQYNIAICIGSVINIVLNIMLVKNYQSVGVSVASVIASMFNFLVILYQSKDILTFGQIVKISYRYIISAMIMYFIVILIPFPNDFLITLFGRTIVGILSYIIILIVQKDDFLCKIFMYIRDKFKRARWL